MLEHYKSSSRQDVIALSTALWAAIVATVQFQERAQTTGFGREEPSQTFYYSQAHHYRIMGACPYPNDRTLNQKDPYDARR